MNLKEIKEIINLMNEHGLSEIEVEREGTKFRIKKSFGQPMGQPMSSASAQYQVESSLPIGPAAPQAPETQTIKNLKEIVSPMVGTFYRAPSPEAAPFVEVGQIVEIGQVVCIVEAMKLMNEIKSEIRGKITEVAVENAEPVEFGQTLFVVEPV
ncbi:MAG: acetyl-CoA carboxylase biotin carboxyl carrier protein [Candidatus Omnitrophota bacterium]